jgi:hypothetical protein
MDRLELPFQARFKSEIEQREVQNCNMIKRADIFEEEKEKINW